MCLPRFHRHGCFADNHIMNTTSSFSRYIQPSIVRTERLISLANFFLVTKSAHKSFHIASKTLRATCDKCRVSLWIVYKIKPAPTDTIQRHEDINKLGLLVDNVFAAMSVG